ncbi:hypothetical protein FACS189419_08440 [Planctomycetales bacterium]|nr:hypothetical protein FACS189419_08440 [Planctomycetales bacterium]
MPNSFFQYEMMPTTWFYVSALIILATFFKFDRFWSVRNFDLIGLILLTPGLTQLAMQDDSRGYVWLFIVGFFICIRLFIDNIMLRRPLLAPNLSFSGLLLSCIALLFFIFAALIINRNDDIDTVRTVRLEQILTTRHIEKKIGINPATQTIPLEAWEDMPPGFRPFLFLTERVNLIFVPPEKIKKEIIKGNLKNTAAAAEVRGQTAIIPVLPVETEESESKDALPLIENRPDMMVTTRTMIAPSGETAEKLLPETEIPEEPATVPVPAYSVPCFLLFAMLPHLAIVLAFLFIGHSHFGSITTGIACATLCLLHPYSSQMIGSLDHLVPAALILWAVALYRRPLFAGLAIGTAGALVWYPFLLFPLWSGFYWHKGLYRFISGFVLSAGAFAVLLLFSPTDWGTYYEQLLHLAGKTSLIIFSSPDGFWMREDMYYRVPIFTLYGVVCFGLFLYPANKHLATLLSCSALLMLGIQFWQLHQGGLYIAWYLPLLILTVFRPNLDDRTARSSVM